MPEGIPQVDFSADAKTPMMLHSFSEPHHAPTNLPITASCPARSCTSTGSPPGVSPRHPPPSAQSLQHSPIRRTFPRALRCQKCMDFAC